MFLFIHFELVEDQTKKVPYIVLTKNYKNVAVCVSLAIVKWLIKKCQE